MQLIAEQPQFLMKLPLFQSVTNLSSCALYYQGSIVRPGFGFLRDGASLGMLREMLVMIRIWGLLKPGCLPIYTATSDNQDSMFLLFRLLTKLWLCCESKLPLLSELTLKQSRPKSILLSFCKKMLFYLCRQLEMKVTRRTLTRR